MAADPTSGSLAASAEPRSLSELTDLNTLVTAALDDPKIRAGADVARLSQDLLTRHVWDRLPSCDAILAPERRSLDDDLRNAASVHDEWIWQAPRTERIAKIVQSSAVAINAVGVLAVVAYFVLRFAVGIGVPVLVAAIGGGAMFVAVVALAVAQALLERVQGRQKLASERHDATVRAAEEKVRVSREQLVAAAIQKAIRPTLRVFVNSRLQLYRMTLTVDDAQGLAELEDPRFQIPTGAATQLRVLFKNMPGGSIGISGPRGAGKTTLIRAFCGEIDPPLSSRPKKGVRVSAPVDYAPRDFILHLFASFCRALGGSSAAFDDPAVESQRRRSAPWRRLLRRYGVVLAAVLLAGGALLIATGTVPTWRRYQPSTDVVWGALLVLAGLGVYIASYLELRRARFRWYEEDQRRLERSDAEATLEGTASQWLRRIKFQQSYASGWSGSLKIPVGIEGGLTATSTFAQQQLSLPEIADGFCDLVRRAAVDNDVVIGIDELDKIGSRDEAESFLNDIKAIFGIEKCFYLISVSEDAMANFERRGLPFRDAFDSALDEVVTVPCLDFRDSMELLKSRVIGMSVPFMALCHCLSGGLARDLIRYARTLVELRERPLHPKIGAMTKLVVARELEAKLHALAVEGSKLPADGHRTELLRWIHVLDAAKLSAKGLRRECHEVSAGSRVQRLNGSGPGATATAPKLAELKTETTCFLYFAATVLEFFANTLTAATMQRAEARGLQPGGIDQLALARQRFSVDPCLAWDLITSFRKHHGLKTIRPPVANVLVTALTDAEGGNGLRHEPIPSAAGTS